MTTYLSHFKAIGFDFDNTIASINTLHNKAWELLLSDLNISITKKDFFDLNPKSESKFYSLKNLHIIKLIFSVKKLKQDFFDLNPKSKSN